MCYAVYLSMGNTIKAISISTLTLKRYLSAAGDFVGVNTRFDHTAQKDNTSKTKRPRGEVSELIRNVIREHHRWEKMPNRREPITTKMIDFWVKRAEKADPDSFTAAMADWMILGIATGMRKSEWAQDTSIKTKCGYNINVDGSCRAFIYDDFSLERDSLAVSKTTSTKLSFKQRFDVLRIRWRFQKNGDNGQEIVFSRNAKNKHRCPIAAARRILARADRLGVPKSHPLSAYSHNGKIYYFKDTEIKKDIQSVAKQVYNITNKAQIGRFTNHSVRVGACTLLHCGEADTLTIKTRLRWRSESFTMYLRNMPLLVAIHNKIVNNTDVDNIVT